MVVAATTQAVVFSVVVAQAVRAGAIVVQVSYEHTRTWSCLSRLLKMYTSQMQIVGLHPAA
jgi:hypothetical protein